MLVAMHKVTNQFDALSGLRQRFNSQHQGLLRFYQDCSNLPYLTSLISIPKLPLEPPNLMESDPGTALVPVRRSPPPTRPTIIPRTPSPEPEALNTGWTDEQQRQLILQQQHLAMQQEQQNMLLMQQRLSQQREFEEQQRVQLERERLAQDALMREQMERHRSGRVIELENELLRMKGQLERDQLTINQYDQRIKQLEGELSQIHLNNQARDGSKDALIKSLQGFLLIPTNDTNE